MGPPLDVPCYAVIFASRLAAGHTREYAQIALEMERRVRGFAGFLGLESARDPEGLGLTVSYWRSAADLEAWKSDAEHRLAQIAGRERFYAAYQVRIARVERAYGFTAATPTTPAEASLLDRLEAMARAIGDELLEMQRAAAAEPSIAQGLVLRRKGVGDLVTRADEHSHARLVATLATLDEPLPLVLEESPEHHLPAGPCFVCDELDGTINLSRGRPGWGISLARVDGTPTHGVFYLPALGVMVTAERGGGCRLNGVPVRLTGVETLTDAVVGCELNPHHDLALRRRYVDPLTTRALTSTVAACAVEATVELLRGRTDLYLNCRGAKIWDFAATALAVLEAGGCATDLAGAPLRWDSVEMGVLYASNSRLSEAARSAFGTADV